MVGIPFPPRRRPCRDDPAHFVALRVDDDINLPVDLPDRDDASLAVGATGVLLLQHVTREYSGRVRGVESALSEVPVTLGLVPFEDETSLMRHSALKYTTC